MTHSALRVRRNSPLLYNVIMLFARQDGLIKTEVVYAILLRSNLPREALGYIWDMCNKTTPGQLMREELFLILAMISVAQVSLTTSPLLRFLF